jgi:hypothetical protein
MAFMSTKRVKIREQQLQGFKYFKAISGMLESLQEAGRHRLHAHRVVDGPKAHAPDL